MAYSDAPKSDGNDTGPREWIEGKGPDGWADDTAFDRARHGTHQYIRAIEAWLREVTGRRAVLAEYGFVPQARQRGVARCATQLRCEVFDGEQASAGSLKGYADYLVALLRDPTDAAALAANRRTRAFGWAPVYRELAWLAQLGGGARAHVRGGGGSGAGFQVYCGEAMLVTAGAGGGGGLEVWLRDDAEAAGADAAAADADAPRNASLADRSSGGGGGGGGGGVQVRVLLPDGSMCELAAGGGGGCARALRARSSICGASTDRAPSRVVVPPADGIGGGGGSDEERCDGSALNRSLRECGARQLFVLGGGGGEAGFSECCQGLDSFTYGFHFRLELGPLRAGTTAAAAREAALDMPRPSRPSRTASDVPLRAERARRSGSLPVLSLARGAVAPPPSVTPLVLMAVLGSVALLLVAAAVRWRRRRAAGVTCQLAEPSTLSSRLLRASGSAVVPWLAP
jgi:hypothetical protein